MRGVGQGMLRRVETCDVRLGMFIHSLEGSWLKHPFWRRRFLLDDPDDLAKLRESEVPAVLVDDERSAPDPAPVRDVLAAPHVSGRPAPRPTASAPSTTAYDIAPCTAAQELARATRTVRKSKAAVTKMFGEARLGRAIQIEAVAPLVDEITCSIARNPSALIGIVRLKSRDEYTYLHSVAVCALMINLARQLGLGDDQVREAGMAGLLHDIGKMAVPETLLSKAGRLTEEEFRTIRTHPQRGHALLVASEGVPAGALDVCLHHHEKMDGSGYPFGFSGDRISLFARMGAICDVYDAITSVRPYKDAWAPTESLTRMMSWEGHFDQPLLERFVRSIGIYPVGMLVRLRSNRLAVVVGENPADLTRPKVRAFYSIMDRALIPPEELTIANDMKGDQIVGREHPERWGLGDWETLRSTLVGRGA